MRSRLEQKLQPKVKQKQLLSQRTTQKQRQRLKQLMLQQELKIGIFGSGIPKISFKGFGIPIKYPVRRAEIKPIPPTVSKRKLKRTPSWGFTELQAMGIEVPKLSKSLEETGLVGRKFLKPQTLPSLGPHKRNQKLII